MKRIVVIIIFPLLSFSQESIVTVAQKLLDTKAYLQLEVLMLNHIENHPKDEKAIEFLGDAYSYQKKWEPAFTTYKKLVDWNYNNANYHFKYGGALGMHAKEISKLSALLIINDIKKAFLKAAQLDSKHIETRWALVQLYMELPSVVGGSKAKSLKYAKELDNLSKIDGYLAKGYIYENDNEFDLAEFNYKMAIKIGDSLTCFNKPTHVHKTLLDDSKKAAKPSGQSRRQEELKHQRNTLHYQIGKIAANYNYELDKGLCYLMCYVKNYTAKDAVGLEWAYLRLAQIYKLKNNKKQALNYINKAITIRSNFPEAELEKQQISNI